MPIELVGTQANSSQKFPPDAEIIFREWAINTTNITAVCSTRVATRLPRNATLPFLTFFNFLCIYFVRSLSIAFFISFVILLYRSNIKLLRSVKKYCVFSRSFQEWKSGVAILKK